MPETLLPSSLCDLHGSYAQEAGHMELLGWSLASVGFGVYYFEEERMSVGQWGQIFRVGACMLHGWMLHYFLLVFSLQRCSLCLVGKGL